MKIVLAQGNPGLSYRDTRHNIGFLVLDHYAHIKDAPWSEKTKFNAYIAELNVGDEKILLIKPTSFYNLTGPVARSLVDFYKINPAADLMAVHDDLALEFGKIRIRKQGSDAGNNGIKSLNQHLGENYTRMRIGTANEALTLNPDTDFVLSKFSSLELERINSQLLPLTDSIISKFCQNDLTETSFRFNTSSEQS